MQMNDVQHPNHYPMCEVDYWAPIASTPKR
nr:MAG TPA: hypothetical protein [Caudoviricetes sp.]